MHKELEREIRALITNKLEAGDEINLRAITQDVEKVVVDRLLIQCRGNQTAVADKVGISRSTIYKIIKRPYSRARGPLCFNGL